MEARDDGERARCPQSSGNPSAASDVPSIIVVQADDVVLSEVVAVLDFDEDQVVFTGVVDAVGYPDRHVDGRPGADRQLVIVEDDHPRASQDEPVLGASCVPLIAEPRPSSYRDALDFVPGLVVQDDISSPGPLIAFSYSHGQTLEGIGLLTGQMPLMGPASASSP
jgi:hypothetical protein